MTTEELFKNAIIATESQKFWSQDLMNEIIVRAREYGTEDKLINALERFKEIGEGFKYIDISNEIKKQKHNAPLITEKKEQADLEIIELILKIFKTAKSEDEAFEALMPIYNLLKSKNLWVKEGRWFKWLVEKGYEK